MRSSLSNPVEAGIDSFTKLMGTFNSMEDSKMKRELMAQNEADRRIENEWKQKEHARTEKIWDQTDKQHLDTIELNKASIVHGGLNDPDNPKKLTDYDDDHLRAYINVAHHGEANLIDPDGKINYKKIEAAQFISDLPKQPEIEDALKNGKKIQLKSPEVLNHASQFISQGGEDPNGNPAKDAKLSSVFLDASDPKNPMLSFGNTGKYPAVGSVKHISNEPGKKIYIPKDVKATDGIEIPGNIDLNSLKVGIHDDGSVSTVHSIGVEAPNGKQVLIKGVDEDGKRIDVDTARANWRKTITKDKPYGDNLGVFKDTENKKAWENSDTYAQQLHKSSMWKKDEDTYSYDPQTGPKEWSHYRQTLGLPAGLLHAKAVETVKAGEALKEAQANINPEKWAEMTASARDRVAQSKGVKEAVKAWQEDQNKNPGQTVSEMRLSLIAKLPDSMDDTKKSAYAKDIILEKSESDKLPTKTSLYAKAAAGDKEAQKALNMMTKDEIKVHQAGKSAEGREKSTIAEVDKLDGVIIKKYRQGNKKIESTEDLDISDESKAELQDKKDKAIKLIEKGKSATAAWNEVDKKRTKDPENPNPPKKLDRTIIEKIRGKNKEVKDDDPEVEKVTKGVTSAKEAVKKLVDAGFNEQHSIDYVKRNSKKAK